MGKIAGIWSRVQQALFHVQECVPPLTALQQQLIMVLEVVRIEEQVPANFFQWLGRTRRDRRALARAFVAKAVYNLPTTKLLVERLKSDRTLRQICGWEQGRQVPSEATFSRAFAEFAKAGVADRVHTLRVTEYLGKELIWHVSRDATAIAAREKPVRMVKAVHAQAMRGRPKKGEVRPLPAAKRLQRQSQQTAVEALAEVPTACAVGTKLDSKGHPHHWVGYKFHIDVGDGGIPLAALTTAASVHDSQVAIPLTKLTAARVASLYDLMDSAYDAAMIEQVSLAYGHVPIIDQNPRRGQPMDMAPDRARRYQMRSQSERVNSDLKENHGGRTVRVRGQPKVHTHLMFGLLVVFAKALMGLTP